jgi:hypothetical protein
MVDLEMIFIPLATLKAACRNQPSNWFLMMVVNLVRLARPWRWLMPKYCFYPVAASACKVIINFWINFRSLKGGIHDGIGELRGVRYIYRILEMALLRWISNPVSLAVVEFLRMMPSSMLLRTRKYRLGDLHPVKSSLRLVRYA